MVPAAEEHTQRLFRARLQSPDGRGRFRLLLRYVNKARFQVRATHPLFNRRLWSLDVEGSEALLVDYQQKRYCRYQGEAEIVAIPLGPLPFSSIPTMLLGYLPLPPEGAPSPTRGGELRYDDGRGRAWSTRLEGGVVQAWTMTSELGRVEWEKGEEWVVLEAPKDGLRLQWRETLREEWSDSLAALEYPASYPDGPCDLGWLSGVADAPWEDLRDD